MTDSYNIFDDLLREEGRIGGINTNSDTDYNAMSEVLKDEEEERRNIMRANMRLVMEKDPNKVGEAQRMALDLNLPEEIALDSDEAINALIQKKKQVDRSDSISHAEFYFYFYFFFKHVLSVFEDSS